MLLKKSEIRKYAKYGPLRNLEKSQIRKYAKYGPLKFRKQKKSNTEYVKYVKYVFSPICHTTSLW